ncbi:MAG: DUF4910 domain-containing protein [Bacillota bacterium]|jgi:aminopeptidase YwaD
MLRKTLEMVQREFSGQRAFNHVAEVCQHHRIQASPGFRQAAIYCRQVLEDCGLDAEIITFPADGKTMYWTQQMFEEWDCQQARLDLLFPQAECLADFSAEPMSLIQRSVSTPPEGIEADIVWLNQGDDPEPYQGWDLNGKLVFTDGDWNKVRAWAVEKQGALGIISDRLMEFPPVRHRFDIPDALMYTSFWWTGHEQRCFGFVLSPKAGDKLRRQCQEMWQAHQQDGSRPAYPRAKAVVQASCYSGSLEDVTALIPGESDEEVIIAAHLCHPRASANDNASGVGTALEAARALQSLIQKGCLPKPKRGIRILLIPEMTGTYAYLATREDQIGKIKAAINLDMVGENQALCQGPLVAEYPPQAATSFVGDVLAAIMGLVAEESTNLGGSSAYALFKHTTAPFSGGSDHYIFSDPTVGVPCPMLIQWPDKYYHTSEDTLDKVDPEMLYRVGCMTATYAYYLANLGWSELPWLLAECRGRYLNQVQRLLTPQGDPRPACELKEQLDYLLQQRVDQLSDLRRFVPADQKTALKQELEREQQLLTSVTEQLWQRYVGDQQVTAAGREVPAEYQVIPKRLFKGPVSMRGKLELLSEAERAEYAAYAKQHAAAAKIMPTYLVYWADGQRTVAEVDHLVKMETGISDPAFALRYFQLLERLGLVTWA